MVSTNSIEVIPDHRSRPVTVAYGPGCDLSSPLTMAYGPGCDLSVIIVVMDVIAGVIFVKAEDIISFDILAHHTKATIQVSSPCLLNCLSSQARSLMPHTLGLPLSRTFSLRSTIKRSTRMVR